MRSASLVVLTLLITSCVGVPPVDPGVTVPSPWTVSSFRTGTGERVTVVTMSPPPTPAHTHLMTTPTAGRGDATESPVVSNGSSITIGTTPWRRTLLGRVPVGVAWWNGRGIADPVPPYWALVLSSRGTWSMAPQAHLPIAHDETPGGDAASLRDAVPPLHHAPEPGGEEASLRDAAPTFRHAPEPGGDAAVPFAVTGEPRREGTSLGLATGGFYPLVRRGRNVAAAFPGGSIRAPRVAIGGRDDALVVVSVSGRPGLTTHEFADILVAQQVEWALNMDGGNSSFVRFSDGTVRPWGPVLRRPGPIRLRITANAPGELPAQR